MQLKICTNKDKHKYAEMQKYAVGNMPSHAMENSRKICIKYASICINMQHKICNNMHVYAVH